MALLDNRPLARSTLKDTLLALIFGTIVSQVFVIGYALDIPLVKKLEREGADIGAQIAAIWLDLVNDPAPLDPSLRPIVIVDIDEESCAVLGDEEVCLFDRIGQPGLLADLIDGASASGPEVIVLDVFPPASDDPGSAEVLAAIKREGPPILAPIEYRQGEGERINIDWSNSICGAPVCGRLRYAPAFAIREDGKARRYAAIIDVRTPEGEAELPSIAYAAAATANPALQTPRTAEIDIDYGLPSIATVPSEEMRIFLLSRYLGNLDYLSARQFAQGPNDLDGQILIIGSSAIYGGDIHATPLGVMTGMEVLANAIRTFEATAIPEELPRETPFLEKFGAVLWSTAILAATLAAESWLIMRRAAARRRRGLDPEETPLWDRYSTYIGLLWIAAIGFELFSLAQDVIGQFEESRFGARRIDILFPVLGVLFFAFVDLMKRGEEKLGQLVDWVLTTLRI